jgi:hypothetical protein
MGRLLVCLIVCLFNCLFGCLLQCGVRALWRDISCVTRLQGRCRPVSLRCPGEYRRVPQACVACCMRPRCASCGPVACCMRPCCMVHAACTPLSRFLPGRDAQQRPGAADADYDAFLAELTGQRSDRPANPTAARAAAGGGEKPGDAVSCTVWWPTVWRGRCCRDGARCTPASCMLHGTLSALRGRAH